MKIVSVQAFELAKWSSFEELQKLLLKEMGETHYRTITMKEIVPNIISISFPDACKYRLKQTIAQVLPLTFIEETHVFVQDKLMHIGKRRFSLPKYSPIA